MIINGFGISLHLLQVEHLELLRTWRNSDFVKQFMQFRGSISEKEQMNWYLSLDPKCNYYFLIQQDGQFIGCCNIKNIKLDSMVGEGGVFACNQMYLNNIALVKAVFVMYNWAFENIGLMGASAEILADNKRALRFNKLLGFELGDEYKGVITASLSKSNFQYAYNKHSKVLSF